MECACYDQPAKLTMSTSTKLQLLAIVPALAIGVIFELFLGHRHDYTGHYGAGYGASLVLGSLWMRWRNDHNCPLADHRWIVGVVLLCIGAGYVTESTIFRFARFDWIDFCSQSLGAVLAGVVLVGWHSRRTDNELISAGLVVGVIILGVGASYAVR